MLAHLDKLRFDIVGLIEDMSKSSYFDDNFYVLLFDIRNELLDPDNPSDAEMLLSRYNWIKFDLLRFKASINKAKTD